METRAAGRSKRQMSYEFYKNLCKLTIGGGVAFWAATIATSLLPIAADYRAAYSNWSIQTVWIASLFVGLIIGCCVSYSLLGFFDRIPTKNTILNSMILSFIALIIATILIDVPRSLHGSSDGLYWFLVGFMFNTARFLFLGFVVGYLYIRMDRKSNIL